VTVKNNKARINIRSTAYNASSRLEINYLIDNSGKNLKNNLTEIEQLQSSLSEHRVNAMINTKIELNSEFIISLLPEISQRRFNERITVWNPIRVTNRVKELLESLDKRCVYDVHAIGVLYLDKDCILVNTYR
jgi:hypothetical protein